MRILIALTYYRPHVSGLTIYVERLARALSARGHAVTVLTSQYDRSLPRDERAEGVRVVRVPVAFRVSKGVVMPTLGLVATRLVREHDALSLHLPQLDAAGIALRGRLFDKPTTLTYHCDLLLPRGWVNGLANWVVDRANHVAARLADAVVAYTRDYAVHSPLLSRYLDKVRVIPPPVEVPSLDPGAAEAFGRRHGLNGEVVIGMAARLATEKGVEYLLEALPIVLGRYPEARVLFAGQHQDVMGEGEYARRLSPMLEKYRDRWTFLGVLNPREMAAFFYNCSVTVLPSINSTESFGLVQIESMLCGTPVVASDLPGVRQPTAVTGMGRVVPIQDGPALGQAIVDVLEHRSDYAGDRASIAGMFSPAAVAEKYEALFTELAGRKRKGSGG